MTFPPDAGETPLWPIAIALVLVSAVTAGALTASFALQRRWTGPYSLRAASSSEKWRWAVILPLVRFSRAPLLGLIQPLLSPLPGQWPGFPTLCAAHWLVFLLALVLLTRRDLERQLSQYERFDSVIRRGAPMDALSSPFVSWTKWFLTEEQKRFLREGYGERRGE